MSSNIRIQRICQHCGNEFEARTTVTQYCGDKCAKQAYKARQKAAKVERSDKQTKLIRNKPIEDIKVKEFLTVRDVAALLNCSRQSVYTFIQRGTLKAVNLSERKTLIKRTSLDNIFEQDKPQQVIEEPKKLNLDIEDCYTLSEVQNLYGISDKALHELIKRNGIPKYKKGIFAYVPKVKIDSILNPKALNTNDEG